jgi:hypothetical protein
MTTDVPRSLLLAAAAALAVLALFLWARGSAHVPAVLADPVRTPGVLNPDVTQATIRETICRSGWTRTIRPPTDYTNALKLEQMRLYREHGPPSAYQEDHLISLELGGHPTDPRNLWPEPYPRASAVDRIENDLNEQVCSGALTLDEAQRKEAQLKHTQG